MKKDSGQLIRKQQKLNDTPYVKKYDENGNISNPITKAKPYLTSSSNRGGKKFRRTNNTQGTGLLVRRIGVLTFEKSKIVKQQLSGKIISHLIASNERK